MELARMPITLGKRGQSQKLYPLGCFRISFNQLEPVDLGFFWINTRDDGIAKLFLIKAPPPTPQPKEVARAPTLAQAVPLATP